MFDVFVDELDLQTLGFAGIIPATTGRPAYHPATMLKLYIYGYLNRVQSSRRLEREAQRNVELIWLTQRLAPDFKTIANFRRDNGPAITAACARFVVLCANWGCCVPARIGSSPWAIECKRLLIDRTVGEIGERLADYTTPGKRNGKRTLIQKHLDRLDRLRVHPDGLARFVDLPAAEMVVKAALVTDALVPMRFTGRMLDLLDRACESRSLADAFAIALAED